MTIVYRRQYFSVFHESRIGSSEMRWKKIDAGIVFIAYQGEPSLIVLKKCVLKIFASFFASFF
jgi:hypothetical protein